MAKKRRGPIKGLMGGQYKPLTDSQVQRIHEAALSILERTGVLVEEPESLRLFEEAGAIVDRDASRVRIPRALVEDAVDWAPSRMVLAGRDPRWDLELEGARVHIGTGGAALTVLDTETGQPRPAVLRDVAELARLVDALDNVHFYLVPVYPTELGKDDVDVNTYYASLANTSKHVQAGVYSIQGIRDTVEMCERIAGGPEALRERPIVSFITSWMVSPLKFATDVTALLIETCRQRIPVVLSAAPMAGSTAPVTLAGMLAQLTAEQLSGVVLTQLAQRGAPLLIGPIPATADMKTGRYLAGAAEFGLTNGAMAQMAQFYRLPIYNSAGMTDAKLSDIQAGFEKAMSAVLAALAGSNFIHHAAGMLENMNTVAAEQFVIDNDILGMAMRVVQGIEVNEKTLALDVIDEIGPGGHYLMADHTLRHMRSEFYYPSAVVDRQGWDMWQQDGGRDAVERAREIAGDILANHRPEPLDPEVDEWIRGRFDLILPVRERR
ncbi:MAG: trimethylamine methyltransferase family protein [Chloroflexota bacterium]|nr:trimethylamine methyltransferase family protein [Chloroflexota bacterium]